MAHGVHRVAEVVRSVFPNVDKVIATVKKVFIKAPSRVSVFKQVAPELPLPPKPILTRWGTWLEAACYYADNFEIVKSVLNELNEEDAVCIGESIKVTSTNGVQEDLVYIKANLSCLATTVKKLESKNELLSSSVQSVSELCEKLENSPGEPAKQALLKLKSVLPKNPRYSNILEINSVLRGKGKLEHNEEEFSLSDIANFKYAPITSCDVERSFSRYKTVLSDNRHSFLFENLKMQIVIKCNAKE